MYARSFLRYFHALISNLEHLDIVINASCAHPTLSIESVISSTIFARTIAGSRRSAMRGLKNSDIIWDSSLSNQVEFGGSTHSTAECKLWLALCKDNYHEVPTKKFANPGLQFAMASSRPDIPLFSGTYPTVEYKPIGGHQGGREDHLALRLSLDLSVQYSSMAMPQHWTTGRVCVALSGEAIRYPPFVSKPAAECINVSR